MPPQPPPPGPTEDDPCEKQYNIDLATCRGISKRRGPAAASRCYSTAMDRLIACQTNRPLPPLDTWNN
jgi:hypothetical protein